MLIKKKLVRKPARIVGLQSRWRKNFKKLISKNQHAKLAVHFFRYPYGLLLLTVDEYKVSASFF